MRLTVIMMAASMTALWAQPVRLPASLEKLSEKAEESVSVTLDGNMLKLVSRLDHDADNARKVIAGLDSVYVRSFKFAQPGEFAPADVEALRNQLPSPAWSKIVGVRARNEDDVDVYFKDSGNGKLTGIVIIVVRPNELTYVSLTGTIAPEQLADLGGHFHIPDLDLPFGERRRKEAR